MKKILICILLTLLLSLNVNVKYTMAKMKKDKTKVNFTMTENHTHFFIKNHNNPYYPTWLYYRFTISNVKGCTIHFQLQRITLTGDYITISQKKYTGHSFDLSVADQVPGTKLRNHYLHITKVSGCGDLGIKGVYGSQSEEPDG
ncbi:hypothetical protein [Bacillus changyiensis]|uniref:hypothetical protein n=1 Tax=Bacillus changyiensis TaxID=3004103 RepID=UPI0022DF9952|nr:hypothetical protein [Bacillus changyiensis]MDA1474910.1 hypothetical protein [Bacillus changyiensis]